MSNLSNESSLDLTDLYEYDEFDLYENPYNNSPEQQYEDGIPLSVELSESIRLNRISASQETCLNSNINLTDHQSNAFVKSSEIFLRIDNEAETATATTTTITTSSSKKTDFDCDRKTNDSIESSGSDVSLVHISHDDIVELHYENEFIDPNADECDVDERHTAFENENEQLLFEGITKKCYLLRSFVVCSVKLKESLAEIKC